LRERWGFEENQKSEGEVPWKFDGNTITPGTTFMKNVAKALRNYILER
jgi:5'-3' exonuclease